MSIGLPRKDQANINISSEYTLTLLKCTSQNFLYVRERVTRNETNSSPFLINI